MKLITGKLIKQLPKLYSTEKTQLDDKKVWIKYFTPDSSFTWYVIEGEPSKKKDDKGMEDLMLFFGLVDNNGERELGYFTLQQLYSIKGKMGLPVERDMSFTPKLVKEL